MNSSSNPFPESKRNGLSEEEQEKQEGRAEIKAFQDRTLESYQKHRAHLQTILVSLPYLPEEVVIHCLLPYTLEEQSILNLMLSSVREQEITKVPREWFSTVVSDDPEKTRLMWFKIPLFDTRFAKDIEEKYYLGHSSYHEDPQLLDEVKPDLVKLALIKEFPLLAPHIKRADHLSDESPHKKMLMTLSSLSYDGLVKIEKEAKDKHIINSIFFCLFQASALLSSYTKSSVIQQVECIVSRLLLIFANTQGVKEDYVRDELLSALENKPNLKQYVTRIKKHVTDAFLRTTLITPEKKLEMAKVGSIFSICIDLHREPTDKRWGRFWPSISNPATTESRKKINKALGVEGNPAYMPCQIKQGTKQDAPSTPASTSSSVTPRR
jgi:hypothetical protein